jgi:hypothetical protein
MVFTVNVNLRVKSAYKSVPFSPKYVSFQPFICVCMRERERERERERDRERERERERERPGERGGTHLGREFHLCWINALMGSLILK